MPSEFIKVCTVLGAWILVMLVVCFLGFAIYFLIRGTSIEDSDDGLFITIITNIVHAIIIFALLWRVL